MQDEILTVPDIGNGSADVIEICVAPGDTVAAEEALLVLESDKATMEVPAPKAGKIGDILLQVGDSVATGKPMLTLVTDADAGSAPTPATAPQNPQTLAEPSQAAPAATAAATTVASQTPAPTKQATLHAGPAVRKLARELAINLASVTGTGARGRITKEDLHQHIKDRLNPTAATAVATGIPLVPAVDFSQWGTTTPQPRSRLGKIAGHNFQRAWLNVPHVTQFDQADITELEAFRQAHKSAAAERGIKLTPLPFILKACAYALKALPQFCASLSPDGEALIHKDYIHIGMAVDTPDGLLVPVIKDVDQQGLWALAQACSELADKARNKQLKPTDMQGGCFTVSSLGAIGGTGFTPIVNVPEVAILGLSTATRQPVWQGDAFVPRLMLPLSLSYDHRAINGADAARFTALLAKVLADIRQLLL